MAASSPTSQTVFDMDRFKELVVFIADLCVDDPTFGAVKLNKILYFADFMAYRVLGKSMTGATYFRLPEGPAPRQLLAARDELLVERRVEIEQRPYFNGVQKRIVVIGEGPDSEEFSAAEQDIVRSVAQFFEGKTAREVSDFSHLQPGWILANDREDIPYETAWLSSDPIDQFDEEVARQMVDQYSE